MREGLKNQQTMHHDCGFWPEATLVHRAKQHQTTMYELIRNSKLYDQQGYMTAADVADFAKPSDLPKLVEWLGSGDEGYRYWGVIGCLQLGKQAATPELLSIMEKLIKTDVKDGYQRPTGIVLRLRPDKAFLCSSRRSCRKA